jgi:glycosyltransferase involved in cell wall biosynthesis
MYDKSTEMIEYSIKMKLPIFNSPQKRKPGWARNSGGKLCLKEVIMFIDVDDFIHPRKCEFMKKVFNENPEVDAVVHNYLDPGQQWEDINNFELYEVTQADPDPDPIPPGWFDIPRTNVTCPVEGQRLHHGHMTCKTKIFQDLCYDESMSLGEDGTFCRSILEHPDYKLFYTPQKLIIYN